MNTADRAPADPRAGIFHAVEIQLRLAASHRPDQMPDQYPLYGERRVPPGLAVQMKDLPVRGAPMIGEERRRPFVEILRFATDHVGEPAEPPHDPGVVFLAQHGYQVMPDSVPEQVPVRVGAIDAEGQAVTADVPGDLVGGDVQQRPDDPTVPDRPDGRKPRTAAAAQEAHQHRLGLVVRRMSGRHGIGVPVQERPAQEPVTHLPGALLGGASVLPAVTRYVRPFHDAGKAQCRRVVRDEDGVSPSFLATEAMVEVGRDKTHAQLAGKSVKGMQQDHRVRAAGNRRDHPVARLDHPVAMDRRLDFMFDGFRHGKPKSEP